MALSSYGRRLRNTLEFDPSSPILLEVYKPPHILYADDVILILATAFLS